MAAMLCAVGLLPVVSGCAVGSVLDRLAAGEQEYVAPALGDEVYFADVNAGFCGVLDINGDNMATGYLVTIECDQPHAFEVTANVEYPGDEYPGEQSMEKLAEVTCAESAEDYVGVIGDDSVLWHTYWIPLKFDWPNDNRIVCAVERWDGGHLRESVKDSGDEYLYPDNGTDES